MSFIFSNRNLFSYSSLLKKKMLLDFNIITKFNIHNFFFLPILSKIVLVIGINKNLKTTNNLKIINILKLLDSLVLKKSGIDCFKSIYINKKKNIIFVIKSTINNWISIFNLLFYLKNAIIPYLQRKVIKLKFNISKTSVILYIDDISALDDLPDSLKKEKVSLKMSFFFSKSNLNYNKLFNIFIKFFGL